MAHIILTASTCYILVGILLWLPHSVHMQTISLNSSLNDQQNGIVRPGEVVIFQCITRGSSIQAWSSGEYIGDRLEFVVVQKVGSRIGSGYASAELIEAYTDNGEPVIISELRLVIQRSILNSSVTCHHVGRELTETISFQLSNTPVLTSRQSCSEELVILNCEIRDSSILAWESDWYIGRHGKRLEFLSAELTGTTKFSTANMEVFAILIENYNENGVQVLNSQLTVSEFQHHSDVVEVTCVNVGLDTMNSYGLTMNYNCNATTTDVSLTAEETTPDFSTNTVGSGMVGSNNMLIAPIVASILVIAIVVVLAVVVGIVILRR